MALCLDRTDPSGMGMFSNCGRREIKKYIIFTKRDEIMNNNQRFFDPNAIQHFPDEDESDDANNNIPDFGIKKETKIEEEEVIIEKPKATTKKKKKVRNRFQVPKVNAPPIGHYKQIKFT